MKYELFKTVMKQRVESKLGNEYTVTLKEVKKMNGITLTGIEIRKDDINIAPIVYLDTYYEMIQDGRLTIYTATNRLIEEFKKHEINDSCDIRFFADYDTIEPHIIFKLINKERNSEYVKDVPHVDFLDLAIIFQVLLPEEYNPDGIATITIRNEHCKIWEVGIDELIFAARRNMERLLPAKIENLGDFLLNLRELPIDEQEAIKGMNIGLYILTNAKNLNGSSYLYSKKVLQEISDTFMSSYYILPSSLHELLILPYNCNIDVDYLKEIVRDVNNTQVTPEDLLSYSVYYYDRDKDELSVL